MKGKFYNSQQAAYNGKELNQAHNEYRAVYKVKLFREP